MKNNNATDVHMQFDTSEVKEGGNQVTEMLTGLETIATNLCESISNAFHNQGYESVLERAKSTI